MSIFLMPDLRPFFAGTYFPPKDSHGRPGFPRVLAAVEDAYRNRIDDVTASADQVTGILRQMSRPRRLSVPIKIDQPWIRELIDRAAADFDPQNGGFGSSPKIPPADIARITSRLSPRQSRCELLAIVQKSLDAMAYGGIRDHLGGAFHRYSTDARWLVPHFEIMLYDNAMLLWIYAEAHRQTGEPRYAAVARDIARFRPQRYDRPLRRILHRPRCRADAQEGATYLWTRQEAQDASPTTRTPRASCGSTASTTARISPTRITATACRIKTFSTSPSQTAVCPCLMKSLASCGKFCLQSVVSENSRCSTPRFSQVGTP